MYSPPGLVVIMTNGQVLSIRLAPVAASTLSPPSRAGFMGVQPVRSHGGCPEGPVLDLMLLLPSKNSSVLNKGLCIFILHHLMNSEAGLGSQG